MDRIGLRLAAVALAAGLASPLAGAAGVYSWRDARGDLHYSDRLPPDGDPVARASLREVTLQNPFGDVAIPLRAPIRNRRADGGPALALGAFVLQLDAANSRAVTVGRAFYGNDCAQSTDLVWDQGKLDLNGASDDGLLTERFALAGYRLGGGGQPRYALDAAIVRLRVDTCAASQPAIGSRAYVKLRWTLRDAAHGAVLYQGLSEGAFDGWLSGERDSLAKAVARATDNLLGDPGFAGSLGQDPAAAPPVAVGAAASH